MKSIYVVMLMKFIIIEIIYCFILLEFRLDFFIVVKLGEKKMNRVYNYFIFILMKIVIYKMKLLDFFFFCFV